MPSPFPGMDPYLEAPQLWAGVHQSLMTYIRDELQPNIRPKYRAHLKEHLYRLEPERSVYPDVTIIQYWPPPPKTETMTGIATLDEPVILAVPVEEVRQPYVEIVHNASGKVVTVIEVLSPVNKTGKGHKKYLKKQHEILDSDVHLVEIDLLSQGKWSLAWPAWIQKPVPKHRYMICVSRADDRSHYALYPILLSDKLPHFAIPLGEADPDVGLNLATVFDRCYDNGGYADFIDYHQPAPVSFSKEEQAWVDKLLADKRSTTD